MTLRKIHLAITLGANGELPTEFRLFKQGWNDTEKGKFLFDAKAARSVMAAYKAWGVDLAIDLEHQMLDVPPGAPDPTARDARGWCRLELRNGELWAVDVRWTPDGAARLRDKRQRYVSPAFDIDPKTRRITKMFNVAITATPATHGTPPLVAAHATRNVRIRGNCMDPELIKKALEALESGDQKAAAEILKAMIVDAAGGSPGDGNEPGAEGDGAEGVNPGETTESVTDPKVVDASAPPDGDSDEKDESNPEKKGERKAMRAMLRHLTGARTFAEALGVVSDFRTSHLALESERQKLAKQRETLENAERRKLVTELVTLGAEFPGTVWADDKAVAMKPRWAKMPIEELRAHVGDQRKARGTKRSPGPTPAADVEGSDVQLSAQELKICKEMNCDPKEFAALKAVRDGKR